MREKHNIKMDLAGIGCENERCVGHFRWRASVLALLSLKVILPEY
jgi:hypothetical protein